MASSKTPPAALRGLSGADALKVALSTVPPRRPSPFDPVKDETGWKAKARRWGYRLVLLQMVLIVAFISVLLIGEYSRATLIALYLPRHPLIISTVGCGIIAWFTRRGRKVTAALLGIQVVLSLIVLFPVMGFSTGGASSSGIKPIRMASWNVHFGHQGRENVVEEVVKMTERTDIIVLQASFGSFSERIKPRLTSIGWNIEQHNEFVLLTRFAIQQAELGPQLPGEGETPSMYVKYILTTPRGTLRVFNVHPYSPRHALFSDDETPQNIDRREDQIMAAVTAARSDPPPFVLLGDTNLPPMSGIGRKAFDHMKDSFTEAGFGLGYTFPMKRPWMRIDRAFGQDVRFTDIKVSGPVPSDHRSIYVELEMDSSD